MIPFAPHAPTSENLREDIVENALCVGCGGCAAISRDRISVDFDQHGLLKPTLPEHVDQVPLLAVCPFSDASRNEDELTRERWPGAHHDPRLGYWRSLHAGHVVEEADRLSGSSGGLTTWLLREMLRLDLIDGVVHVKEAAGPNRDRLFAYGISTTIEEVNRARGSRYYPIELSQVVDEIRRRPGRYAVVAIPCFAKTLRNLMRLDPVLDERVVTIVGLVCGHLKSRHFADYLGWAAAGVPPELLETINFRKKLPLRPASDYAVEVIGNNGAITSAPLREYFATSWEVGAMRNPACDFCDDVMAETADIVFGDAWIPPFDADWRGCNVVLTRDVVLASLLNDGHSRGEISLSTLSVDEMTRSQAGGLRHRREGLAHRLKVRKNAGRWAPRKRFGDNVPLDVRRRATYDQRAQITEASHRAFQVALKVNSLALFQWMLAPRVVRYYFHSSGLKRGASQSPLGRSLRRIFMQCRRNPK